MRLESSICGDVVRGGIQQRGQCGYYSIRDSVVVVIRMNWELRYA